MQCNAKSKQSGERCKKSAVQGYQVCEIHGGKTPRGIASATYKTGAYSKYLPKRLMQRYDEALTDENLLELRNDIALIDARIAELLTRLEAGDLGGLWLKLKDKFLELNIAIRTKDVKAMQAALTHMEALINQGASDYNTWQSLREFTQDKRRLIESERKRLVQAEQMITSEQAMLVMSALLDSVRRNVNDTTILSAIQAEFVRLVGTTHQYQLDEPDSV